MHSSLEKMENVQFLVLVLVVVVAHVIQTQCMINAPTFLTACMSVRINFYIAAGAIHHLLGICTLSCSEKVPL